MVNITIGEIVDYVFCPHYYKLKYVDKSILDNVEDVYDSALHKCYYTYLNNFKNTGKTDLKVLTSGWGKIWIKEKNTAKIMMKTTRNNRDTYNTLRKSGIRNLIRFDTMISNVKQYPILINKGYTVKVGKHVSLSGIYEYIRESGACTENHAFEILKLGHVKDGFMTEHQMSHGLYVVSALYAFEKSFNTDGVPVQGLWLNMSRNVSIPVIQNEEVYRTFEDTVTGVARCINSKIFPCSPDEKCFICSHRNQCRIGV